MWSPAPIEYILSCILKYARTKYFTFRTFCMNNNLASYYTKKHSLLTSVFFASELHKPQGQSEESDERGNHYHSKPNRHQNLHTHHQEGDSSGNVQRYKCYYSTLPRFHNDSPPDFLCYRFHFFSSIFPFDNYSPAFPLSNYSKKLKIYLVILLYHFQKYYVNNESVQ